MTKFFNQPWPLKQSGDEEISVTKTNPKDIKINGKSEDIKMEWRYGHSTYADLTKFYKTFVFNSSMASIAYKANIEYMAHSFQLRFGSEHLIDDKRFDMEFQLTFISKNPLNDFKYGIISVLFNRTNYADLN